MISIIGLFSGDGGSRTRVRKIRPQISTSLASLFWRHRLGPAGQGRYPTSRLVFRSARGGLSGIPTFVTLIARAVGRSSRSAGLPQETELMSSAGVRPRAGELHKKCGWHLWVCADFAGSAPPGLQPVTSLLRRSLSSPVCGGHYNIETIHREGQGALRFSALNVSRIIPLLPL
jgi:hypothetical protein